MIDSVIDLDGTVVFSSKCPGADELVVDRYANGSFGVMRIETANFLANLVSTGRLAIVTTRTLEQFTRMALPWAPPALVDNGWRLLRDGRQADQNWTALIDEKVAQQAEDLQSVLHHLEAVLARSVGLEPKVRSARFIQIKPDASENRSLISRISTELRPCGWHAIATGRTITVLPTLVDKGRMLALAADMLGVSSYQAAGDALLDAQMLTQATCSRSPAGSSLHIAHLAKRWTPPSTWMATVTYGPDAGPEIAQWLNDT